jgi:hypothetical protein
VNARETARQRSRPVKGRLVSGLRAGLRQFDFDDVLVCSRSVAFDIDRFAIATHFGEYPVIPVRIPYAGARAREVSGEVDGRRNHVALGSDDPIERTRAWAIFMQQTGRMG